MIPASERHRIVVSFRLDHPTAAVPHPIGLGCL
jgi:hypothetical protein